MSGMEVGGWFYLPHGKYNQRKLHRRLEFHTESGVDLSGASDVLLRLYEEDAHGIKIPRQAGFLPRRMFESAKDCTLLGDERDFGEKIELRPHQIPLVGNYMEGLSRYPYGGLLCAGAGIGKTVMGLEVIRRLGRTTLILVHKTFLVNQWVERIQEFLPGARIGIVQQNRCEFGDDYDIVIGMLQSLARRNYPEEFYHWPGIVLSDEVHRLGAATWHPVIPKFPGRVRIGLTATPRRRDSMEPVFFWHIGPILARVAPADSKTMKPVVKIVDFRKRFNPARYLLARGRFNHSRMITDLAMDDDRNKMLATFTERALRTGRKVLFLSHRLDQLDEIDGRIRAEIKDIPHLRIDRYIGGRSEEELAIAANADLILGTYQMADEALDIPDMDTLVQGTPKGDVQQAVGRIQRVVEGKKTPVVIDPIDRSLSVCISMARTRRRVYLKLKAEIRA